MCLANIFFPVFVFAFTFHHRSFSPPLCFSPYEEGAEEVFVMASEAKILQAIGARVSPQSLPSAAVRSIG